MDKNEISTRFHQLATGDQRPATARLRDIFDDVEVALKAKVSHVTVLAELNSLGYNMQLSSFKSALQRIRKERKETKNQTEPVIKNRSSFAVSNENIEKEESTSALVRPPGISNSAWSELQVKDAKAKRT